jgi:phage shock protein A
MADAQRYQDARAALDTARREYHDARARAWSGAPGATAALEDAARRYAQAVEALQATADDIHVDASPTDLVSSRPS